MTSTERIILITSATSGIGKATAIKLAKTESTIVMINRNKKKSEKVKQEIQERIKNTNIDYIIADFSSLKQVKKAIDEFKERYTRLHVLINNAGTYQDRRKITGEGLELTFAVNYVAPFFITTSLIEILKFSAPARVINVASDLHKIGELNFDDLQIEKNYSGLKSYGRSKRALIMFTYELAERLANTGVTVNCVSPGMVRTNLGRDGNLLTRILWKFIGLFIKSPEKAARYIYYLGSVRCEFSRRKVSKSSSIYVYLHNGLGSHQPQPPSGFMGE